MTMLNKKLSSIEAEGLVFTSDDDARSSLPYYGTEDIPILTEALRIARRNKMLTRIRLIERRIKQLTK